VLGKRRKRFKERGKIMKKYLINYNTGAGDIKIIGDLDDAMNKADLKASYTQTDITIYNNNNEKVATRTWVGLNYENQEIEENDPIVFGTSGYYADWEEV